METGPAKEGVVLDADGKTIYAPSFQRNSQDTGQTKGQYRHPDNDGRAQHARDPRARIYARGAEGARPQIRVYRGGWWLPLALGVGIPLLFVAGIFIFTALMTVGLVFVFIRSFFGVGRPVRSAK